MIDTRIDRSGELLLGDVSRDGICPCKKRLKVIHSASIFLQVMDRPIQLCLVQKQHVTPGGLIAVEQLRQSLLHTVWISNGGVIRRLE